MFFTQYSSYTRTEYERCYRAARMIMRDTDSLARRSQHAGILGVLVSGYYGRVGDQALRSYWDRNKEMPRSRVAIERVRKMFTGRVKA